MDYASPYLLIWLGIKRYSNEFVKPFPSAGGWLDQDAYTMLALEVCDEIYEQEMQAQRAFADAKKARIERPKARGNLTLEE